MEIQRIIVGIHEANTYIINEDSTNEALIIDPGDEAKIIMKYLDRNQLQPIGIILTHYHQDHIGASEELKKKYKCNIYAHKKELEGLKDPKINQSTMGRKTISVIPDKVLSDGDMVKIGNLSLCVIHTPGHTPGGICLKIKDTNNILTGDTIFRDDLGRTDLAGGSEDMLKKSIINKVSKWPDETIIYPGHGEIATMKEIKKRDIPYLNPKR